MKTYNYSEITKVSSHGIELSDGTFIDFNKCVQGWANHHRTDNQNRCVGARSVLENERYFIFYVDKDETIKLTFIFHGFLKKRKSCNAFDRLRLTLIKYRFTSYDLS